MPHEAYLGDGLYASFDGYAITLSAPRDLGGVHWIALEPTVLLEFLRYAGTVSNPAEYRRMLEHVLAELPSAQ